MMGARSQSDEEQRHLDYYNQHHQQNGGAGAPPGAAPGAPVQRPGYDPGADQTFIDYSDYGTFYTPPEINCYACTFHVLAGHAAGEPGCRDPFRAEDVSKVPCAGPCAKMYLKTGEEEYTLTRHCVKNCKELKTEHNYVDCCTTDLCNRATAGPAAPPLRTAVTLAACALIAVWIARVLAHPGLNHHLSYPANADVTWS